MCSVTEEYRLKMCSAAEKYGRIIRDADIDASKSMMAELKATAIVPVTFPPSLALVLLCLLNDGYKSSSFPHCWEGAGWLHMKPFQAKISQYFAEHPGSALLPMFPVEYLLNTRTIMRTCDMLCLIELNEPLETAQSVTFTCESENHHIIIPAGVTRHKLDPGITVHGRFSDIEVDGLPEGATVYGMLLPPEDR